MAIIYPEIKEAEAFHGFRTVHFYESECRRNGYTVSRVPVTAPDGSACVALITYAPGGNSPYAGVDILTPDDAHCIYTGSIPTGKPLPAALAEIGYHAEPEEQEAITPISLHEVALDEELTQLSLFG